MRITRRRTRQRRDVEHDRRCKAVAAGGVVRDRLQRGEVGRLIEALPREVEGRGVGGGIRAGLHDALGRVPARNVDREAAGADECRQRERGVYKRDRAAIGPEASRGACRYEIEKLARPGSGHRVSPAVLGLPIERGQEFARTAAALRPRGAQRTIVIDAVEVKV